MASVGYGLLTASLLLVIRSLLPTLVRGAATGWVVALTLGLAEEERNRRIEESKADFHDHKHRLLEGGHNHDEVAVLQVLRLCRGMVADTTWRIALEVDEFKDHFFISWLAAVGALAIGPLWIVDAKVCALVVVPVAGFAFASRSFPRDWAERGPVRSLTGDFLREVAFIALIVVTLSPTLLALLLTDIAYWPVPAVLPTLSTGASLMIGFLLTLLGVASYWNIRSYKGLWALGCLLTAGWLAALGVGLEGMLLPYFSLQCLNQVLGIPLLRFCLDRIPWFMEKRLAD